MIGTAPEGFRAAITGIGSYVPDRVMTNDELSAMVDTSDEWIIERTGIRERRIAAPEQALSDLCRPAIEQALAQAGAEASSIDLLVVATVTPDMAFPSTGAILADDLGMPDAGAYDLSAGCTGFMYALAQAYGMMAGGLAERALVVGGDVLSRILDWTDRATCVLFGDGAGAVVLERVENGGFLGFELGADGSGGPQLYMPAGGSRLPASAETVAERKHFAHMNGREVFKFATRVLVSSAEAILARRAGRSTRSTSTSRIRRMSASSTMPLESSGFPWIEWLSMSTGTATRHRARFRSRLPRRRRKDGSTTAIWC